MGQDHGIHLGSLEHVDVLALLLLVRHIVDDLLLLVLFFLCILTVGLVHNLRLNLVAVLVHSRLFLLVGIGLFHLKALRQRHVLSFQILEQDVIRHLLTELIILQAAELDERADIVPIFLVLFLFGLAHARQLIRNLLADVVGNLLHKAVVLQCASGHVERQIRAVDHAL